MTKARTDSERYESLWEFNAVANVTSVILTIGLWFALVRPSSAQEIIAPGAKLEVAITGLAFAEGPANDGTGAVYFTDQPNDRILRGDPNGKMSVFLAPCGRSNGLCFGNDGGLWACADNHNELWKIDRRGHHHVIAQRYDGKLLNGPNDVWVRPDDGVYITDPCYQRSYWIRGPKELATEGVYFIAAFHKRLFCPMGSDGMTIDSAGDIYITGQGVTVFDKNGVQVDQIAIDQPCTGNICFGGKDMHTLFITASKAVYTLRMNVYGVGSQ